MYHGCRCKENRTVAEFMPLGSAVVRAALVSKILLLQIYTINMHCKIYIERKF
jgi:hypothetical protein